MYRENLEQKLKDLSCMYENPARTPSFQSRQSSSIPPQISMEGLNSSTMNNNNSCVNYQSQTTPTNMHTPRNTSFKQTELRTSVSNSSRSAQNHGGIAVCFLPTFCLLLLFAFVVCCVCLCVCVLLWLPATLSAVL